MRGHIASFELKKSATEEVKNNNNNLLLLFQFQNSAGLLFFIDT